MAVCTRTSLGPPRMGCPGPSSGMRRNKDTTSVLTVTSHDQDPSTHGWQVTDFGTDDSKPISEKQAVMSYGSQGRFVRNIWTLGQPRPLLSSSRTGTGSPPTSAATSVKQLPWPGAVRLPPVKWDCGIDQPRPTHTSPMHTTPPHKENAAAPRNCRMCPSLLIWSNHFSHHSLGPHSQQEAQLRLPVYGKASETVPHSSSSGLFVHTGGIAPHIPFSLTPEASCNSRKHIAGSNRPCCVLCAQVFFSLGDIRKPDEKLCSS
ncbi:uncharacterized protein LOC129059734 [Pongo abelii]|uniref:uncharacterized protein LOC129059734 n=1 Tax=Pongo abelii TaxID=9601 RepID=UPI003003FA81